MLNKKFLNTGITLREFIVPGWHASISMTCAAIYFRQKLNGIGRWIAFRLAN